MKLRATISVLLTILAASAMAQTEDLLISEYVEGSVSNNAIEIFNGSSDTINLSGYSLQRYSNGAATAVTILLSPVDLEPGEVFVIAHTSFAQPGLAQQLSADLNFDGNDAVVLSHGGTPIDRIGRVGEDPGEYWSCARGTTQNHTLQRLPGVCAGAADPGAPFDPCDGWEFFPVDTFDGLGRHSADCGTVDLVRTPWGGVKALYR
jgi:predicted extracellular nuclease